VPLYREFSEMPVVSISDSQRQPLPFANWQTTIYHGLPPDLYTYRETVAKYLAFLGRMFRKKSGSRNRNCWPSGHTDPNRGQRRQSTRRILISRHCLCSVVSNRLAGAIRFGCN
jgi:hypothetical protein